jgi:hypothetical protein
MIPDECQVRAGLVTDTVIAVPCRAVSTVSPWCCPTTVTSTVFRTSGAAGSAPDQPFKHRQC